MVPPAGLGRQADPWGLPAKPIPVRSAPATGTPPRPPRPAPASAGQKSPHAASTGPGPPAATRPGPARAAGQTGEAARGAGRGGAGGQSAGGRAQTPAQARAPRSPRARGRARLSAVFAFAFLPLSMRKMKVAVASTGKPPAGRGAQSAAAAGPEPRSRAAGEPGAGSREPGRSPRPARWQHVLGFSALQAVLRLDCRESRKWSPFWRCETQPPAMGLKMIPTYLNGHSENQCDDASCVGPGSEWNLGERQLRWCQRLQPVGGKQHQALNGVVNGQGNRMSSTPRGRLWNSTQECHTGC
ncbi:translation initiation factor IF-2-like isoform X1 [Equus quagga]|uniref:translation initiation factor IF-2-like isoform X1 n=1 Tax=Equus quagga TaxID=89248 RepID=UPI001EE17821|nr:translation initiation factor IF-2-like isoform X1 [Equus quagga]